VVILIGMVLLAITTLAFATASTRMAARRSAQVFSRDLALARGMAVRGREKVTIKFYESSRWYEVKTAAGRSLAIRRFGPDGDVNLSGVALDLPGDSIVFSIRGVGTITDPLGSASFTAAGITYRVTFNAIGASRVAEF
jgi:hypothetical protein